NRHSPALSPGARSAARAFVGRCPSCGGELASDSPLGLCPQCLFQAALSSPKRTPPPNDGPDTAGYQRPGTPPAVADLTPLFPQFEFLELIRQGGMGAVYKPRQIKLDRIVGVEILPTEWGKG